VATHSTPHRDLAGYVLGVLDPSQSREFESHLRWCEECRTEVDELRGLPALLAAPVELPADLRARTFARIEADGRPPAFWPPPARRPRRRLTNIAAVAAAVIVAGAGVVGLTRVSTESQGIAVSGDASTEASTLTLDGPRGTPQRGVASVLDNGVNRIIHLEVSNLAVTPAGRRYVCWFVGPRDSGTSPDRVKVASFVTDASGSAAVDFSTTADPQRFARLDVTSEPENGGPRRRGATVLTTK
jgi:anti-sigma-K factor RskA